MTLDLGRLVMGCGTLGTSVDAIRRRRLAARPARGEHEAPITIARIWDMGRAGTLNVCPEEWCEVVGNCVALRRYAPTFPIEKDGVVAIEGPHGRIDLVADASLARGTHRWGKRREDPGSETHQKCSYCGAPGQRIGARCEYCQVAVSP